VALGNVVVGIPLNAQMEFTGNFFTLLRPFPLAVGLLGLAAILLQGSTYAAMKTTGSLQNKARNLARTIWAVFIVLFVLCFILALISMSGIAGNLLAYVMGLIVVAAWFLTRKALNNGKDGQAFLMSSVAFAGLWGIVGAIHYPNLVFANNDPALSLTLSNSSSTQLTLTVMLIIALVGMPFVIGYTIYAYKLLKGKVMLGKSSI
jgi:cytochrome d ubiquinol oxidase subunit II